MDQRELNEELPKRLIGKRINSFTLSANNDTLRLFTDDGTFILTTEGDCCSFSWIEHIEGSDALRDAVVYSVEDIDMPERPYDAERYDVMQFYGLRIITNKGHVIIDYRNSSNGYYGGSIDWTHQE